jgi:MFS family permease
MVEDDMRILKEEQDARIAEGRRAGKSQNYYRDQLILFAGGMIVPISKIMPPNHSDQTDATRTKDRLRQRDFNLLFLVMLVTGAGNTALQSILPTLGRTLGVPDSAIAAVFSVSALIWIFSAPYWARRSDRQGRRKMVILGISGFTVSTSLVAGLLFAGLSGWISPAITLIFVIMARMIFGIFGSAAPPAAQAMIALRTAREERTKALTLLSSAFGLGTILGLALAPWLVFPIVGLAGPAIGFAFFGAVALFFIAQYLSDDSVNGAESATDSPAHGANVSYPSFGGAPAGASVTAATSERSTTKLRWTDPRIWPWMFCGLIMGHAQAMAGAAMGFLVIDRLNLSVRDIVTQQTIGLVLMAGAGAALLVQWGVIPRLNLAPRTMMLVGLAFAIPGLLLNSFSSSLYGIATAYALASVGFGFTRPAFTAGSSLAVGRKLQGAVAGQVTSVNGSSFVLGPTIGVGLYEVWRPLPFAFSAIVLATLIPYVVLKLKDAQ